MKSPTILALILALGVAFVSSVAQAQGGYAGVSIGSSDIDEDIAAGLITSGTVDGTDSGFKLFGGVEVNPNVAVEVAFVDLGEATYSGDFVGTPVTNGRVEVSGIGFSAIGMLPVQPNFKVLGRIVQLGS